VKTLVLAAHPDDEILGCGGTIARLRKAGEEVRVVILGEGVTSRQGAPSDVDRELRELRAAAIAANAAVGVSDLHFEGLPDNKFDSLPLLDVVKRIERHVEEFHPVRIFTHSASDLNIDHKILHLAALTASRPLPGQSVRELFFFEVRSSTEWNFSDGGAAFQPRSYWDISGTLADKQKALKAYQSEMRPWPHSRSLEAVEALARHRGAEAGVDAAEAFVVGRITR
jgi:LmbE family N-acetylglucosaminyl deacetylase